MKDQMYCIVTSMFSYAIGFKSTICVQHSSIEQDGTNLCQVYLMATYEQNWLTVSIELKLKHSFREKSVHSLLRK